MPVNDLNDLKEFLAFLATVSGPAIARAYRSPDLRREHKSDGTIVTDADRRAEELLRREIAKRFPDHGIIGEEFGRERDDAEYVWVLDPIDGTISFAAGCPLFATLVGVLRQGQPILGMIHQPVTGQICIGDNHETTLDGRSARVRSCGSLEDAVLLTTDIENIARYRKAEGFDKLRRRCRLVRTWGDAYGYLLLVGGRADIMLDPIMNPWDILPLIPVVCGAGGTITDWAGNDPVRGDSCVAASPSVHAEVLAILNGA